MLKLLEWLPRIKPVRDELRPDLFEAELYLSLIISRVPEGADQSQFKGIGLHHLQNPAD